MSRPNLSYLKNVTLAAVGIAAGVWCGLSGMALAPLLAPLLGWMIGIRGQRLGSSVLVVTASASLAALLAYGQAGQLHWSLIVSVIVASTAGSVVGSVPRLAALRASGILRGLLAAAIGGVGAWMVMSAPGAHLSGSAQSLPSLILPIVAGFAAGLIAAIGNIGGILIVPALLEFAHTPLGVAQATSLAMLAALSSVPVAAGLFQQRYAPQVAVWCAFGALLGALYGSRLAVREPLHMLSFLYGSGLIVVAVVSVAASFATDRQSPVQSGPSSDPSGTDAPSGF